MLRYRFQPSLFYQLKQPPFSSAWHPFPYSTLITPSSFPSSHSKRTSRSRPLPYCPAPFQLFSIFPHPPSSLFSPFPLFPFLVLLPTFLHFAQAQSNKYTKIQIYSIMFPVRGESSPKISSKSPHPLITCKKDLLTNPHIFIFIYFDKPTY